MVVAKVEKKSDTELKLEELIMRGFLQKTVTIAKGLTFTLRTLSSNEIAFVYSLVEKKLEEFETNSPLNQQFIILQTQALLTMAIIRKNGEFIQVDAPTDEGLVRKPLPDDILGNPDFSGHYIEVSLTKMNEISKLSGPILNKLSDEYNKLMEEVTKLISGDEVKNA